MPPMMTQIAQPPAETGSTRLRPIASDGPLPGRSPMDWRSGPAPQEGSVMVHLPNARGVRWIPAEEAAKLPLRARGTISDQAYVIAKDPREVDDGWREDHENVSNPLQLSGLPAVPRAGPSSSAMHRGEQHEIQAGSWSLFRNAPGTGRAHRGPPGSTMARTTSEPLGLGITSLPQPGRSTASRATEPLDTEPSPAPSWGTIPTTSSRHSSLGNLRLNNLPPPHPFAPSSEFMEQLPIGELNGGPIVLTDAITPRQSSSVLGGDWSVSGRSDPSRDHRQESAGLLFVPSAGSSRQVEQEPDSRHSSRPSTRHSRHQSMSGDEREPMVGLRTGIALYSSRPATNYSSSRGSSDPSTGDPSPPAQSRPRSGASTRSHAESTYSSHSHHSSHSVHPTHSSSDAHRRARRGSTASALDGFRDQEPVTTWTTVSAEMQPYGASREPYTSDSRSQKSQESIPRAMDGLGSGPASMSSLLLSFDPPSTSSAVTGNGEEAAGIHAPRPVNGRRASMLNGAWNARSGR
ncbi:hypothetical protein C8Q80DRAFT_794133 [Daedaleopsis nitida]|nr:hypothetical protein C8Q80DRAFT_794133 [Daedaleopsis nitida]